MLTRETREREPPGRERRSPRRGVWRIVALVGLWLVPVVAVVVAVPLTEVLDAESVATRQPGTVTVGSREVDQATAVNTAVTLGPEWEIRTQATGVVTSLAPAGPIELGAELFAVDDVPVLAYRGPVLYRDLSPGAQGADVAALGDYLVELGLLDQAQSDEHFGPATTAAVRRLQDRLGVDDDGIFRLSYIAYVPEHARDVAHAVVRLSDAVTAGTAVLTSEPTVESVVFTAAADGATLDSLAGAELALTLGDRVVDVSGLELTGSEAADVTAAVEESVQNGSARPAGGFDTDGVYSGGVLRVRTPPMAGVVPATAVLIDADGRSCVIAPGPEPLPLTSAIPGGEAGTVRVDETVIGREIIRDVTLLPDTDRTCG